VIETDTLSRALHTAAATACPLGLLDEEDRWASVALDEAQAAHASGTHHTVTGAPDSHPRQRLPANCAAASGFDEVGASELDVHDVVAIVLLVHGWKTPQYVRAMCFSALCDSVDWGHDIL
jgi:hypothetical protein